MVSCLRDLSAVPFPWLQHGIDAGRESDRDGEEDRKREHAMVQAGKRNQAIVKGTVKLELGEKSTTTQAL